jgi:molybdopterin-binding protein
MLVIAVRLGAVESELALDLLSRLELTGILTSG